MNVMCTVRRSDIAQNCLCRVLLLVSRVGAQIMYQHGVDSKLSGQRNKCLLAILASLCVLTLLFFRFRLLLLLTLLRFQCSICMA
jgi:hypothetical protein